MAPQRGGGRIFKSCDIFIESMPTAHVVSLTLVMYSCCDSAVPSFCHMLAYATTANCVRLHLLVSPFAQHCFCGASSSLPMYYIINMWAYVWEKSTHCNNFIQKGEGGVGLFSKIGLVLRARLWYMSDFQKPFCSHCSVRFAWHENSIENLGRLWSSHHVYTSQ